MSFFRVSTNYLSDNMKHYNKKRGVEIARVFGEQANQKRIQNLRDDPLAASHGIRYDSMSHRKERFSYNLDYAIKSNNFTDSKMQNAIEMIQRMRELAVQGASSTMNKEQKKYISTEIDEIIKGLLDIGNSVDGEGNYIFSGTKTANMPFRATYSRSTDGTIDLISNVSYMGNEEESNIEIDENRYISGNLPGSEVFWAEDQRIASASPALAYSVVKDSTIKIDGHKIELKEGDNVYSIMNKINSSSASVKTVLDPITNSLILEGTSPHKVFMEDVKGSVLHDLGMIVDGNPPYNLNPTVIETGGSIFDIAMHLRDSLRENRVLDIGGSALRGMDEGMDNFLYKVSELGSRTERMEFTKNRHSRENLDLKSLYSMNVDADVLDVVNRFKKLEMANQAALAMSAKAYDNTLLNFLR